MHISNALKEYELSLTHVQLSQIEDATAHQLKAIQILEVEPRTAATGQTLLKYHKNLLLLFEKQNSHAQTKQQMEKILQLYKQQAIAPDQDYYIILYGLAGLCFQQKEYQQARCAYEELHHGIEIGTVAEQFYDYTTFYLQYAKTLY